MWIHVENMGFVDSNKSNQWLIFWSDGKKNHVSLKWQWTYFLNKLIKLIIS